jgi:hypothetical protein
MKVYVETILECPPERVWAEVQTSRLLQEVIYPLLKFTPLPGMAFPEKWQPDSIVLGSGYAFSFIPLGIHTLRFECIDARKRQITTRESNFFVRQWDHVISVNRAPGGSTHYSDEIEIDAGLLTPIVWLYATIFYRHRQRRWRLIARRLVNALARR